MALWYKNSNEHAMGLGMAWQTTLIALAMGSLLATAAMAEPPAGPFGLQGYGARSDLPLSSSIQLDRAHDVYYWYESDISDTIKAATIDRALLPAGATIESVDYRPVLVRTVNDSLTYSLGPDIEPAWQPMAVPGGDTALVFTLPTAPEPLLARAMTPEDFTIMRASMKEKFPDDSLENVLKKCEANPESRDGYCGFSKVADQIRVTLSTGQKLFLQINYPLNC